MDHRAEKVQELNVELASTPFIGEKIRMHGNTYECVNVDWDRRDDTISATYRNVDKEDPEIDYSRFSYLRDLSDKPGEEPNSE